MANYETMAVLDFVTETGNLGTFKGLPPKAIVKFLRKQFKSGKDQFIKGSVLERINYRKVKLMPLACCLSCGGDHAALDLFCSPWLHFEG
jgi:hypothetical protein